MGCATYAGQPLKAVAIGIKALRRITHPTLVYTAIPSEDYDYSTLVVFPLLKEIGSSNVKNMVKRVIIGFR